MGDVKMTTQTNITDRSQSQLQTLFNDNYDQVYYILQDIKVNIKFSR